MGSVQESSDQEDAEGFDVSVLFLHCLCKSCTFSSWLYFTIPCSRGPCTSLSQPLSIIPCPCSALSSCPLCSLLSCSCGAYCPSLPCSHLPYTNQRLPHTCPSLLCSCSYLPCSCGSYYPCISWPRASVQRRTISISV